MSGRGYAEEGVNGYVEVVRNGHTMRKESLGVAGDKQLRARCLTCSAGLIARGTGADAALERWADAHIAGPVSKKVEPIPGEEKTDGVASSTEATQA